MPNIPEIPEFPKDLLRAFKTTKMCIFIGAGVSRNIGLPGWLELAHNLAEYLHKNDILSKDQLELCKSSDDPLMIISVCQDIIEKANNASWKECYSNFLIDTFLVKPKKYIENTENGNDSGKIIYKILKNISNGCLIAQTNYDLSLEFLTKRENLSSISFENNITNDKVLYLHGRISDSINVYKDLLLTQKQYNKLYISNEGNGDCHLNCLKHIFKNYHVLFLGYGLGDFEIKQIISLVNDDNDSLKKYYILQSIDESDKEEANNVILKGNFYESTYKIKPILYNVSNQGHSLFVNVLQELENKIPSDIDNFDFLDEYLNFENINDKTDEILFSDLISILNYKKYFFDKVEDIKWFDKLNELKLFEFNGDVYFFIVLNYLFKISNSIKKPENTEFKDNYSIKLVKIIKNILVNDSYDLSYRIASIIGDILLNIELEYIDLELINLLKRKDIYIFRFPINLTKKILKEGNQYANLLRETLDYILSYEVKDNDINPLFDYLIIQELYENLDLISTLLINDYEFLINKLKDINKIKNVSLHYHSSFNIKPEKNEHIYKDNIEIFIVYLLIEILCKDHNSYILLKDFLLNEKEIFIRIAFNVIDKKFKQDTNYSSLFYSILESLNEQITNVSNQDDIKVYAPELWPLLENNCDQIITDGKKHLLDKFIESFDIENKKYWLSALKNCECYKDQANDINADYDLNFDFSVKSGWVEQISPINYDAFTELSLNKKIEYLKNINFQQYYDSSKPFKEVSKEGLGDVLKEFVLNDIIDFTENIELFNEVPFYYIASIIEAYKNCLFNNIHIDKIDWKKVVNNYIEISIKHHDSETDFGFFENNLASLIEGIINKELIKYTEIFNTIDIVEFYNIKLQKPIYIHHYNTNEPDVLEFYDNCINTSRGKYVRQLFLLIIKNYNLINNGIKDFVLEKLNNENDWQLYSILGYFTANIYFLSNKYDNTDFFNQCVSHNNNLNSSIILFAYIDGFIQRRQHYYETYSVLKRFNLESIFNSKTVSSKTKKGLIQVATLFWLSNDDKDIFNMIINRKIASEIHTILCFFSTDRHREKSKKIITFWKNLYIFELDIISDEEKKVLLKSLDLIPFLDHDLINETNIIDQILFIMEQGLIDFNTCNPVSLPKNLTPLVDKNIDFVCEIIIKALNNNNSFINHDNVLINLVNEVYNTDQSKGIQLAQEFVSKDATRYSAIHSWLKNNKQ